MINIFNNIKALAAYRGLTLSELINKISLSNAAYYRCQRRNSIESRYLFEIAEVLDIPVIKIFEDLNSGKCDNKENG